MLHACLGAVCELFEWNLCRLLWGRVSGREEGAAAARALSLINQSINQSDVTLPVRSFSTRADDPFVVRHEGHDPFTSDRRANAVSTVRSGRQGQERSSREQMGIKALHMSTEQG